MIRSNLHVTIVECQHIQNTLFFESGYIDQCKFEKDKNPEREIHLVT